MFEGNPFPGLRPFEFDENYLFFGREEQVTQLLQRLGNTRFLAVVGIRQREVIACAGWSASGTARWHHD